MEVFGLCSSPILLSARHCGSNMWTHVSSPVSKLEITRETQFSYFHGHNLDVSIFDSRCANRVPTLYNFFHNPTGLSEWPYLCPIMRVRLPMSFNENCASSATTAFTALMFVSVIEVFGLPESTIFETWFPAIECFRPH